jgi:hypothetical protein
MTVPVSSGSKQTTERFVSENAHDSVLSQGKQRL